MILTILDSIQTLNKYTKDSSGHHNSVNSFANYINITLQMLM